MTKKTFNRKGFTLIELLIVVAIIGILAVALVPTISDAPARARDAARKTLVSGAVQAAESHNLDKGGYPADSFCLNASGNPLLEYFGSKAPESTQVNDGVCTDTAEKTTAPFYLNVDAVSYYVGISLESANGNANCDDKDTAPTGAANDGNCFVIARGAGATLVTPPPTPTP